jgi:hypothetical protein
MTDETTQKQGGFSFVFGLVTSLAAFILLLCALFAPLGEGYQLAETIYNKECSGSNAYQMIFGSAFNETLIDGTVSVRTFANPMAWSLTAIIFLILAAGGSLAGFVFTFFKKLSGKSGSLYLLSGVLSLLAALAFIFIAPKELAYQISGGSKDATSELVKVFTKALTVGQGFRSVAPLAFFGSILCFLSISMNEMTIPLAHYKLKNFFHPEGIQKEMLRYSGNSVSADLGYLGIIGMAAAFCIMYSTTTIYNVELSIGDSGLWVAFDVFFNIILLLALFLTITEMKAYSRPWSYVSIAIGAVEVVRPFIYPLALMNANVLAASSYTVVLILFLVSGIALILGGISSLYRGAALRAYLSTVEYIEGDEGGKR